jgi:hypothetical protein
MILQRRILDAVEFGDVAGHPGRVLVPVVAELARATFRLLQAAEF